MLSLRNQSTFSLLIYLFTYLLISPTPSFAQEDKKESPRVVVRINDVELTEWDSQRALSKHITSTFIHADISEERKRELGEVALENLIEHELLYQEAKRRGMKVSKKKVEKKIDGWKKTFKGTPQEKSFKDKRIISFLKRSIERDILSNRLLEEIKGEVVVTEKEVKRFFEKERERFRQPEQRRVRVIFFRFHPEEGVKEWQKKEKKAWEVYERLTRMEDFAELAREFSDDEATRQRGGDIGYVHKGTLDSVAETALDRLKMGEISEPLWSTQGFFILKLEDIREPRYMEFLEVKNSLMRDLIEKRKEEEVRRFIEELRSKAKIEVFTEVE